MFVTHRLEEASEMCDRMTVLRDGRLAGHLLRDGGPIAVPRIIDAWSAAPPPSSTPAPTGTRAAGPSAFRSGSAHRARGPTRPMPSCSTAWTSTSAGRDPGGGGSSLGSGRTELARAIFGRRPIAAGTIALDGQPDPPGSPADAATSDRPLCQRTASSRRSSPCCPSAELRLGLARPLLGAAWLSRRGPGACGPRAVPQGHVDPHGLSRAEHRRLSGGQPAEGDLPAGSRAIPRCSSWTSPRAAWTSRQGRGASDPRATRRPRYRGDDDLLRASRGAVGLGPHRHHAPRADHGEMPAVEATRRSSWRSWRSNNPRGTAHDTTTGVRTAASAPSASLSSSGRSSSSSR